MTDAEKIKSQLEMKSIGIEYIEFKRNPLAGYSGDTDLEIGVQYIQPRPNAAPSEEPRGVRLRLVITAETEGEQVLRLEVVLSATFVIHEKDAQVFDHLFRRNTLAIMMPYMRSEVTLVTAQPGSSPLVLPPIDINKLVDSLRRAEPGSENTI